MSTGIRDARFLSMTPLRTAWQATEPVDIRDAPDARDALMPTGSWLSHRKKPGVPDTSWQLAVGNNIAIGSWLSYLDSYSNKLPVITVLKSSLGGCSGARRRSGVPIRKFGVCN
ncbi:hypothetical protein ACFX13_008553 [Malus domestica]